MIRRLFVLGSLYVAQGLPFGFFTQALPVRMREEGVGLSAIGLSSLLALPWALKFLLGPTIDRHGARIRWILPLQVGSTVTLLVASTVEEPSESWPLVLGAVFVTNLFAATQDVATDGLAVDLLRPEERGWGNGVQVAGYRAGMMVGGGLLLARLPDLGWAWTMRALAACLVLTTLPVLLARDTDARASRSLPATSELRASLAHLGPWLLVLGTYKSGDALAGAMVRPLLVDQGHGLPEFGLLFGEIGFGASLFGALSGGALVSRFGRRRALVIFALLQAACIGGYVALALAPVRGVSLALLVAAEHLTSGMATAALFTCMMDRCRATHAATDYTVQACAVVMTTGLFSTLSGVVADLCGYPGCFALGVLLALAGALVVATHRTVAHPHSPSAAT